ncbi:recombinase family protein [Aggregicoccus sp. 17bor-14]|uniref:recombinase family protein n=1 Tax=Myxococcaceae TaxID=31 RepID=UPI00129C90B2|nr:recombinase family protein [Simulacricoccus sp. 17bor-14]MRI92123.1 recombinase family protein [Aggregicoccus sp. 17bor-14]
MSAPSVNAIYIRTSTADQDGAAQIHALRRASKARGWTAPREFIDLGHSGAKASRPALDALKRAARAGEVRQVMVFGLDRLGRSLRDLLVLLDELAAVGCAVSACARASTSPRPRPAAGPHDCSPRGVRARADS